MESSLNLRGMSMTKKKMTPGSFRWVPSHYLEPQMCLFAFPRGRASEAAGWPAGDGRQGGAPGQHKGQLTGCLKVKGDW